MRQQLLHGVEGEDDTRAGGRFHRRFGLRLARLADKTAADRVIHLVHPAAIGQFQGKTHAVRMLGQGFALVPDQARGGRKRHHVRAQQRDFAGRLDGGQLAIDRIGRHVLRRFAHQAQNDGLVRGMAHARQRQRAIQGRLDAHYLVQRTVFDQKTPRRRHRAHRVGTRRPDADLEQVKYAHIHGVSLYISMFL